MARDIGKSQLLVCGTAMSTYLGAVGGVPSSFQPENLREYLHIGVITARNILELYIVDITVHTCGKDRLALFVTKLPWRIALPCKCQEIIYLTMIKGIMEIPKWIPFSCPLFLTAPYSECPEISGFIYGL